MENIFAPITILFILIIFSYFYMPSAMEKISTKHKNIIEKNCAETNLRFRDADGFESIVYDCTNRKVIK